MIVMKFGGTSVEDATAIDRSCQIVAQRMDRRPLVVVSALAGTTNGLLQASRLAAQGEIERALAVVGILETRHVELLPSTAGEFAILRGLLKAVETKRVISPQDQDQIVAYGEILSSLIFADRMRGHGHHTVHIDSRECIITDDNFGKAAPLLNVISGKLERHARQHIDAGRVVVMAGFIGATAQGVTTTLGRGASDYSAAIVGAAMDAEEIQIWTDVDGMMTTDPRIVPEAWKVKELTFVEAAELAYFGAKVLHPLTVMPAVEKNIPVTILNSRNPSGAGTRITTDSRPCRNLIKAIAVKRGITAVTVSSSRMLGAHGFLAALFAVFDRHSVSVDMVATSEVSVSLTLDDTSSLPGVIDELNAFCDVQVDDNLTLICLVGSNLKYTPGVGHIVFGSIRDINVLMVSHGASTINLSFLVAQQDADAAIRKLHASLFQEFDPQVFEPAR